MKQKGGIILDDVFNSLMVMSTTQVTRIFNSFFNNPGTFYNLIDVQNQNQLEFDNIINMAETYLSASYSKNIINEVQYMHHRRRINDYKQQRAQHQRLQQQQRIQQQNFNPNVNTNYVEDINIGRSISHGGKNINNYRFSPSNISKEEMLEYMNMHLEDFLNIFTRFLEPNGLLNLLLPHVNQPIQNNLLQYAHNLLYYALKRGYINYDHYMNYVSILQGTRHSPFNNNYDLLQIEQTARRLNK